MVSSRNLWFVVSVVVAATTLAQPVLACPFCSAVSQTFSEEMQSMDVAVICELQKAGVFRADVNSNPQAEVPKSTFVIKEVLKGGEFVTEGDTFKCVYFGEAKKERPFLAMATDAPRLQWTTPLILTSRAREYLELLKAVNSSELALEVAKVKEERRALRAKLLGTTVADDSPRTQSTDSDSPELLALNRKVEALEAKLGTERLDFFQKYLEDEDEMLARDAYDEFANAPYAAVQALKSKIDHSQLIEFLNNPEVPSNRRRLYFTMLGVCGTVKDAAMLEEFMLSKDRKKKAGLDALIACYLLLTGEEGLAKVEQAFFQDSDVEYADTYAAIMAIRFHGSEVDVIPRTRLTKSLRYMLDRPDLADLVIPDLAKWEDWSVMGKLVDLFVTADENSSWVRVPVINYLRACPLPIAKEKIEFLKTVDPDSVKRAMTFFPAAGNQDEATPEPNAQSANMPDSSADSQAAFPPEAKDISALGVKRSDAAVAQVNALPSDMDESAEETRKGPPAPTPSRAVKQSKSVASIAPPETLHQVESMAEEGPNFWKLLGVMVVSMAVCFYAMRNALGLSNS